MTINNLYAEKTWNVVDEANGDKLFARLTLSANFIQPLQPYFSLTGILRNKHGREEKCGSIHDDIVRLIPETKKIARLHLADRFGVPMHAYENAAWWAGHGVKEQRNLPQLARHLRAVISHAEIMVMQIDDKLANVAPESRYREATEFWKVAAREHKLLERWNAQAREVLSTLKLLRPLP